jgi:two-component system response regulator AtoC
MFDIRSPERDALEDGPPAFAVGRRRIAGSARGMAELDALVARLGPSSVPVVVTGETGAGKEDVVRRLHGVSGRKGRLCVVNCATIPQTLVASTLFGHERGAFTGAVRSSAGMFEQAEAGTLCLDEVAELSGEAQAALLRVVETKQVTRVGSEHSQRVDVRLVASSQSDLEARVRAGQFRADLWYRLDTVTLRVPPLRERRAEVQRLAETFLSETLRSRGAVPMTIDGEALAALRNYAWPGNIRELRNVMQRAGTLCDGSVLRLAQLPEKVRAPSACAIEPQVDLCASFAEQIRAQEMALLREGLRRAGGCKSAAAELLRMPRRTLMRKVKLYGLG